MKTIKSSFEEMAKSVPQEIQKEVEMEFAISNRIYELMKSRGLSQTEFAQAIGKRPCEITKWLSGQHNFTLRTISSISHFFGEPIVQIYKANLSLTPQLSTSSNLL